MKTHKEQFSHCANILPVKDVIRSLEFYHKNLGFDVEFTWNDPVHYAVLKRGDVGIHLSKVSDCGGSVQSFSAIYIFVYDVDAVYKEFLKKQVEIHNPPADQEYKMREFDITDPDGHLLTFGKGLD